MTFITSVLRGVAIFFVIVIVLAFLLAGTWPTDEEVDQKVADMHGDVAADWISQYQDASNYGDAMDRCVRAGFVVESYLQAGQSENYRKWKQIEREDCREAGLSR